MSRALPIPRAAGKPSRPVHRPGDWEVMYAAGEDRWDIGGPSPPLVAALARGEAGPPGRALVPGCGRGHDVRLLAERGFDATGVDFAPAPIREARALAKAVGSRNARFERRDLFDLPRSWDGTFDLVFEQTCFCAIHPGRRADYVRAVHRVLRPGGLLLGLFFDIRTEEGPPFGTTRAEIRGLFEGSGLFRLERARVPAESTPARQGREWLAFLRRLPGGGPRGRDGGGRGPRAGASSVR